MVSLLVTILVAIVLMALILWGLTFLPVDDQAKKFLVFVIIAIVVIYVLLALTGVAPPLVGSGGRLSMLLH